MSEPLEVTHQPCPASPEGDTHHMVERTSGNATVLKCWYCGKTWRELHDALQTRVD